MSDHSLSLYQLLLDSMGDAVIASDQEGKIIEWNPAAEALYGWTKSEVVGKPIGGLLATRYDDPQETHASASATVARKGIWKGKVQQTRKDGTVIHIESIVCTYRDPNDKRHGLVAINRDISEKERLRHIIARLEYLNRVLLRLPTIDDVFITYAGQIQEIITFDRIDLWLLDINKEEVQVSNRFYHQKGASSTGQRSPLIETPLGLVHLTREVLIIQDVLNRPKFTHRKLLQPEDRALMLLPLMQNSEVVGGIAFFSQAPGAFSLEDANLLNPSTEQLSLALTQIQLLDSIKRQAEENARLLHKAEQDARYLQQLSKILIQLQERERANLARELHDEIGQP